MSFVAAIFYYYYLFILLGCQYSFVSGAVSVSDPRVVLACLRYLAASHVRNRVFVDKAHFLMCFHVNRAGIAYTDWYEMVALADDLFSADLCVVRHETTLKVT